MYSGWPGRKLVLRLNCQERTELRAHLGRHQRRRRRKRRKKKKVGVQYATTAYYRAKNWQCINKYKKYEFVE